MILGPDCRIATAKLAGLLLIPSTSSLYGSMSKLESQFDGEGETITVTSAEVLCVCVQVCLPDSVRLSTVVCAPVCLLDSLWPSNVYGPCVSGQCMTFCCWCPCSGSSLFCSCMSPWECMTLYCCFFFLSLYVFLRVYGPSTVVFVHVYNDLLVFLPVCLSLTVLWPSTIVVCAHVCLPDSVWSLTVVCGCVCLIESL